MKREDSTETLCKWFAKNPEKLESLYSVLYWYLRGLEDAKARYGQSTTPKAS